MYRKKISVCLATYNGEKYIEKQINSIRAQLGSFDEIIVSDDGSTDNTVSIINNLKDDRIKFFYNKKKQFNYGHYYVSANFENAIKKSTGDIIFLCDQDDIWVSNRVEFLINYLEDYDLVINNAFIINENEDIVGDSFFSINTKFPRGIFRNLFKPKYHGCCMVFNRGVLDYVLPFPTKLILHDSWIGILTEQYGKVLYTNEKLIFYRRHSSNTSYLSSKSTNPLIFKILYRLELLSQIFLRICSIRLNNNRL